MFPLIDWKTNSHFILLMYLMCLESRRSTRIRSLDMLLNIVHAHLHFYIPTTNIYLVKRFSRLVATFSVSILSLLTDQEILKTQILKGNIKPHITWEWCAQHGEYVEEHGLNSRITKELISLIDNPACLDELTKIWNEQGFNVSLNYSARSSSLVFSSPKYQTPTIINR
eukprot:TRINITY_DN5404_c0_g1_i1.p1 TRINITY_DN5404_c0_g1~~TRINITY_DN5404_c0_g1_i1.p1  ORF type:complete len:169 (+),score=7.27 TRINITY_DN5404_c0_g1_i1:322-828(+)